MGDRYRDIVNDMHEKGDINQLEKKIIYHFSKNYSDIRDFLEIYDKVSTANQVELAEDIRNVCLNVLWTVYRTTHD